MLMAAGYILLVALLLLAAFYSGTETAMTSVSRNWIQEQAKKGDTRAKIAEELFLRHGDRLLGTVLIGNNITQVCMANLAKLLVAALMAHFAIAENASWDEWATSIVLTPIVLIFGEAVPKALGRNRAEAMTLRAAKPLRLTWLLLRPAVACMGWLARVLSPNPSGHAEQDAIGTRVSREDMKALAAMASEQGLVNREAGEMIQTVLELDQRPVETAMVPLVEVQSLAETATVGELLALVGSTGYLHIPVYRTRVDRITGVVSCREVLARKPQELSDEAFREAPIAPFVSGKLPFVPESQTVSATLEELRQSSQNMAIVVDEYGGMTGMVTVEDLVEIIVGNLNDDREEEFYRVRRLSAGAFLCSGRLEIRVLEECLGVTIPNTGFETAAGLVLRLAGKIPSPGDRYTFRQFEVTVLQVEDHRITKLKFQQKQRGSRRQSADVAHA